MNIAKSDEILTTSQVARRISRAFAANGDYVSDNFSAIERQSRALANVLDQFAETLQDEAASRMYQEAGETFQQCIEAMFSACKRTISGLDTLVDQNQVIRKHRTVGGFAIERSWRDAVLTSHDSIMWTADGGDLHSLIGLLQIYTQSLSLLVEALNRSVSSVSMNDISDFEQQVTAAARGYRRPGGRTREKFPLCP